jgi:hypothetical protein
VFNELVTESAFLVTKQVISTGGSIEGGPDSFTHASAIALHVDVIFFNGNELNYVSVITTSDTVTQVHFCVYSCYKQVH